MKKGTRLSKFEKKCDEGFLLGYSTTSKAYRVWNLASGTLEEVHDVEFDETNGSQEEDENLDDVRGTQLVNAMKNMDIGDIRPRDVIDVEDDKNQVLSNSNVQVSGSHDQVQASASDDKVQDQQQVASSSSQSMQAIKCKCSNQPMSQEIIHWTLSLVIFQEVCKLDQDWLHFVSTSHLCHPLNLRR